MTNSQSATRTDKNNGLTAAQTELCRDTAASIRKAQTNMFNSAFEIGELLIKVKDQLDHGQFGKWRSSEFGYTQRTAQNYMNAFRYLGDKSETVSRLPMKTIYDLASLPEEKCDEIVALITNPANPPVAEIKKLVAHQKSSMKPAVLQKDIATKKAEQQSETTSAAHEASQIPTEKRSEAEEAELRDLEELCNTLDAQALTWVKKLGLDMTQGIANAVRLSNAEVVMAAMLKAAGALQPYFEAEERDLKAVLDSITLDASEFSVAPEGDIIQELDLVAA